MDDDDDTTRVFVNSMINAQHHLDTSNLSENTAELLPDFSESNQDSTQNDNTEKHSAVWTSNATTTLLKLYESKLEMLETPKRKKRIWLAISQSLKDHDIDMSPDQVRWKINALTRKYKRCFDIGAHDKFKYFKEMDNIYSKFNFDGYGYTVSEILDRKNDANRNIPSTFKSESKAIIELRKIRLANRIESDKSQAKIHIERQWLEYLNRQDLLRMRRDDFLEKSLKLKEQELVLRKRELELKQSLDVKSVQLKEKHLNEIVQMEREKCELLKQIFL